MTEKNAELELIKAIIKANLKKSELIVLAHLMKKSDVTLCSSTTELAHEMGIAQPNIDRALKGLKAANVLGSRSNGIFVKSKNSWGKKTKA